MRILQVVKTNEGASWAFNQAKWLHDNGVDIVTVLPEINGGMAERYKKNNMQLEKGDFSLPISRPWKVIERSRQIREICKGVKPDLIHSHFVTNVMMLRIALRGLDIPILFQVPGPLHLESKLYRKSEVFLSTTRDYWAGACKKTRDIYLDMGIEKDRVFLAYYGGYGGESCNEYEKASGVLRNEFNIQNDKILIGMIGYFYKPKIHMLQFRGLKGHEDFVDAISIARNVEPRIMGIIIGDAWGTSYKYVKKVKKYAKKKCGDNIIFTGFKDNMKEIYRELNIAIHPSHSENLGGAAESLAAGVPTISTNIGGFPDIVINNKTGYTVEIKKPNEIAMTILKMLEFPEKTLSMTVTGQEYVRNLLDINTTGQNVFEIYKKILKL